MALPTGRSACTSSSSGPPRFRRKRERCGWVERPGADGEPLRPPRKRPTIPDDQGRRLFGPRRAAPAGRALCLPVLRRSGPARGRPGVRRRLPSPRRGARPVPRVDLRRRVLPAILRALERARGRRRQMGYESLCFETEGSVAVVTLNRPARRNALSLALMRELLDCLGRIGEDRQLRAVILAAAGNVYSAGHDLSELVGRDVNDTRQIFDVCAELMTKIQSIPQPVIAEVQGLATAAGCQLVATCDLAVAAEDARFATPGVRIGLFCTTPMVALTRAVGRKRALRMLLTGDPIDARTAAEWG